jgi:putative membrane protein
MDSLEEMSEQVLTKARNVGRGFIAGAIGGAVASWVMNRYHEIESQPVSVRKREASSRSTREQKKQQQAKRQEGGEDATVKTAAAISRQLFDHELSQNEKKIAGTAVHYGYGSLVGGIYGALAEVFPGISAGLGIPYATALWFFGDEIAVPALGFSKPPHKVPAEKHAAALSSHFVYGMTMDIVRRVARRII